MAGQIIPIKATWEGTRFHCPACGAEIFNDEGVTLEACPHLLFTWVSEAGEMDYLSPDLPENLRRQGEVSALDDESDPDERPNPNEPEYAAQLEDNDVVFCLECSGIACGPVSMTIAIGLRFPDQE